MDIQPEIARVQTEFYETNQKNTLFKKQQKYDCAKQVLSQIPLEQLLQHTCYHIPNTNRVYIDYTIFKTYASPEIFDTISKHIFSVCAYAQNTYVQYEVHLNINGLTVSAAERYKDLIISFCNQCLQHNTSFASTLEFFAVYYTPAAIEHIKFMFKPFVFKEVYSKFRFISKADSANALKDLFVE